MITPPQTRANQSAEIAARADERALAAQRDIVRVESALTDRIDHLGEVVEGGLKKIFEKLEHLQAEVSELKTANAQRTAIERVLKWLVGILVTIALAVASMFLSHWQGPKA